MKALAEGRLDGDTIVIDDVAQANRLHNKSHAGIPETGNTLRLHRVEATYCMEKEWLEIPGTSVMDLLRMGASADAQQEVDHLCYRDLRERGLTIRITGGQLQAWQRGETPKQEPWFRAQAFAERVPIQAAQLADDTDTLSVVDEDGMVTHYTARTAVPTGDWNDSDLPAMNGILLDDHVFVDDANAAKTLASNHMGTEHGDGRILSLVEAESLARRGLLTTDGDVSEHANERHADHAVIATTYDALQAAGVLPKSGFRFGTHLRAYTGDPNKVHAEWLIHCTAPESPMRWSDLSRAVRLAHGVRKRFLVAIVADGQPVRFVELAWFRP